MAGGSRTAEPRALTAAPPSKGDRRMLGPAWGSHSQMPGSKMWRLVDLREREWEGGSHFIV